MCGIFRGFTVHVVYLERFYCTCGLIREVLLYVWSIPSGLHIQTQRNMSFASYFINHHLFKEKLIV